MRLVPRGGDEYMLPAKLHTHQNIHLPPQLPMSPIWQPQVTHPSDSSREANITSWAKEAVNMEGDRSLQVFAVMASRKRVVVM